MFRNKSLMELKSTWTPLVLLISVCLKLNGQSIASASSVVYSPTPTGLHSIFQDNSTQKNFHLVAMVNEVYILSDVLIKQSFVCIINCTYIFACILILKYWKWCSFEKYPVAAKKLRNSTGHLIGLEGVAPLILDWFSRRYKFGYVLRIIKKLSNINILMWSPLF